MRNGMSKSGRYIVNGTLIAAGALAGLLASTTALGQVVGQPVPAIRICRFCHNVTPSTQICDSVLCFGGSGCTGQVCPDGTAVRACCGTSCPDDDWIEDCERAVEVN